MCVCVCCHRKAIKCFWQWSWNGNEAAWRKLILYTISWQGGWGPKAGAVWESSHFIFIHFFARLGPEKNFLRIKWWTNLIFELHFKRSSSEKKTFYSYSWSDKQLVVKTNRDCETEIEKDEPRWRRRMLDGKQHKQHSCLVFLESVLILN